MKLILDKSIIEKIKVYSDNGTKDIQKYIDLDKYPKILGGNSDDSLCINPGPW